MDKEKRIKLLLLLLIFTSIFFAICVNFVGFINADKKELSVEVLGAIEKPGIYKLNTTLSIGELIKEAGGFKSDADQEYIKYKLNLSAKVFENTKVYVPFEGENSKFISLNNATKQELDSLTGIGETTAEKIIQNRPYTEIEEIVNKKIINSSTFEKIKDLIVP